MERRISVPDGGAEELREFIVAPYVIRYTVTEDAVIVARLWHAREYRPQ